MLRFLNGFVFCLAAVVGCTDATVAATELTIHLHLNELRTHLDSVSGYALFMRVPSWNRSSSLTSPAGTVYSSPSGTLFGTIRSNKWNVISSSMAGDWTYTSRSRTDPLDVESYTFSFAPLEYSQLTAEAVVFDTPTLSEVTKSFSATWSPPTNTYGYGFKHIDTATHKMVKPGEVRVDLDGVQENAYFEVNTSGPLQLLDEYVSISSVPNDPLYQLSIAPTFSRTATVRYLPKGVVSFSGDFNQDGNIDGADFMYWQRNFGQPFGTGAADLAIWQEAFGERNVSYGTLPEPAAAALLAIGCAGLTLCVRRRR